MRSLKTMHVVLAFLVGFTLASLGTAFAQNVPNLPGFPSSSGGGSSSSGGTLFWVDAGPGFIFAPETVLNPDGGHSLHASTVGNTVFSGSPDEALSVYDEANAALSGGLIGLYSGGKAVANMKGALYASGASNTGQLQGLNLWAPAGNIAFAIGSVPGPGSTLQGNWSNKTLQFAQTTGQDAIAFQTNGALLHLGTGTTDTLRSDGVGDETPGYFEASDYVEGVTGFCTGATCAGTAFASFPAAAGVTSRLRYDSTNVAWRSSNGSAWVVVDKEWTFGGYSPVEAAAALHAVSATTSASISKVTQLTATNIGGPTSATGNIVFTVYDSTAAGVLCTLTKACNTGSATQACATAVPAAHVIQLRQDSSGCGVGTVGDFNLVAQFNGG